MSGTAQGEYRVKRGKDRRMCLEGDLTSKDCVEKTESAKKKEKEQPEK